MSAVAVEARRQATVHRFQVLAACPVVGARIDAAAPAPLAGVAVVAAHGAFAYQHHKEIEHQEPAYKPSGVSFQVFIHAQSFAFLHQRPNPAFEPTAVGGLLCSIFKLL